MMLLFSKRKKLVEIYEKWIKENNIKDCPESFIAFLYGNDLINVENALAFIKKGGAENLIMYYYIQQWDGKLPETMLGEDSNTLLDITK